MYTFSLCLFEGLSIFNLQLFCINVINVVHKLFKLALVRFYSKAYCCHTETFYPLYDHIIIMYEIYQAAKSKSVRIKFTHQHNFGSNLFV